MPDMFGGLVLPVPVPTNAKTEATSDPFLDVLVSYLQAVINAVAGDAWRALAPASANPVIHTDTHNPGTEVFRSAMLPALFAWRQDTKAPTKLGSWDATVTTVPVLWVPSREMEETLRQRHPFRNAIEKSIRYAFAAGRHPSWVVEDDEYYDAETYGSVFLYHAKIAKLTIGPFQRQDLVIESHGGRADTFPALSLALEVTETLDLAADGYDDLAHVQGVVKIGPVDDLLTVGAFTFKPTLLTVTPSTGSIDGGTTITIIGSQLDAEMTLTLGGVACTDITQLDDCTFTAVTGAHAEAAVDAIATMPSGATATLANAFTYED